MTSLCGAPSAIFEERENNATCSRTAAVEVTRKVDHSLRRLFCYIIYMNKIETLREKVKGLYEAKHEGRADWSDWLYENHVFVVADNARELSKRFGAGNDLAEAAAMLHDVADAVMSRFEDGHEVKSLDMALELLTESGFKESEIEIVLNDAIKNHSCYPGHLPETLEGKIIATADAKAHLDTDFYYFAQEQMKSHKTEAEFKTWVTEKISRDFNVKIFFPEIKEELKGFYETLKEKFDI